MRILKLLFSFTVTLILWIHLATPAYAIPGVPDGSCSNWPPVASSGEPATSAAQAAANAQCDGRDYDETVDQCFWRNENELGNHIQGWQCIIYDSSNSEPTAVPPTSSAPNLADGQCSNWPPVASSGSPATSAAQAAANAQCNGRDYDDTIDQCFWRNANELGNHVQGWQCIIDSSSNPEPTAVPPTAVPPTATAPPTATNTPTSFSPTATALPPTPTLPSTSSAPNLADGECSNWPPVASSGSPATSAAQAAANAQCDGRDYDDTIDQCFWRNQNELGNHAQGWQCIIYGSSNPEPTAVPPTATTPPTATPTTASPTTVPPTIVPPTSIPSTATTAPPTPTSPSVSTAPNLAGSDCSNWPPVASGGNPPASAAQAAANAQCDGRDYDDTLDQCFWRNENELGNHVQGWQCIIYGSTNAEPTAVPPTVAPPTVVPPTVVPPTDAPPTPTSPSTSAAPNLASGECSNWPPVASSGNPATTAAQAAANAQCDGRDYDSTVDQCFWRNENELGTHVQGWQCIIASSSGTDPGTDPDPDPGTDPDPDTESEIAPNLADGECSNWPPVASSGNPATTAAQAAANAQCDGRDYDSTVDQCVWRNENELGTHVQGWQCIIASSSGTDPGSDPDTESEIAPNLADGECSNWPPVSSGGNTPTSDAQAAANDQCDGRDYDSAVDQCVWRNENELGTHAQGWQCIIASSSGTDPDTDPDTSGGGNPDDSPLPFDLRLEGRTLSWRVANTFVDSNLGFQITQSQFSNNQRVDASSEDDFLNLQWTHLTSAHSLTDYYTTSVGDDSTEFRFSLADIPNSRWIAGTTFEVQTYSQTDAFAGYQAVLRKPTIPATGGASTIGDFLSTFGESSNSNSTIPGSYIGTRSEWDETPDFDEDFNPIYQGTESGEQSLNVRNSRVTNATEGAWRWYFAPDEITPSPDRDQGMNRSHAILTADGFLKMDIVGTSDTAATYSYIGTDNNIGSANNERTNGYTIDPENGVFVEASVRLDEATPAAQAWWAFWLMDADGDAYNCNAANGSEVDLFEFVPDQNNGFNAAIFRDEGNCADVTDALHLKDSQGNDLGFTYGGPQSPNLPPSLQNVPNYMDGNYHRIGMYYDTEVYAFYIDNKRIFELEPSDRDWITTEQALSIRLTWELQQVLGRTNSNGNEIVNPWNRNVPGGGGVYGDMIRTGNPTVYVDYVKVWQKTTPSGAIRTPDEQRSNAMTQAIKALESYASTTGTYEVAYGGFNGSGEGWYLFDADTDYEKSIASVLIDKGHLDVKNLIKDPQHTDTDSTVGDLMVYRCQDRVAVFSPQASEGASADDMAWWDSNDCNRDPIDKFDATYFKLSRPLSDQQNQEQIFLPVSFR